jgi:hypothetical protein
MVEFASIKGCGVVKDGAVKVKGAGNGSVIKLEWPKMDLR